MRGSVPVLVFSAIDESPTKVRQDVKVNLELIIAKKVPCPRPIKHEAIEESSWELSFTNH